MAEMVPPLRWSLFPHFLFRLIHTHFITTVVSQRRLSTELDSEPRRSVLFALSARNVLCRVEIWLELLVCGLFVDAEEAKAGCILAPGTCHLRALEVGESGDLFGIF